MPKLPEALPLAPSLSTKQNSFIVAALGSQLWLVPGLAKGESLVLENSEKGNTFAAMPLVTTAVALAVTHWLEMPITGAKLSRTSRLVLTCQLFGRVLLGWL